MVFDSLEDVRQLSLESIRRRGDRKLHLLDCGVKIPFCDCEACRFIVANRERTIDIYMKASGETDRNLVGAGYDALLKINGFGVNGGMTRKGLEVVTKFAVENGAKSIPIESWSDFQFQEKALKQIGRVAE